jgi:acyl-CoA dehydrogenase
MPIAAFSDSWLPVGRWSATTAGMKGVHRGYAKDVEVAVELARRFNREVIRPLALELDARVSDDPLYLPHEFVQEATRWGLYSLWIPRAFGGGGLSFMSLNSFVEELSSECVGLANVVGVHYLGVASLAATWNLALCAKVFGDVIDAEKAGKPCLISLAITEPEAGSDAEEVELADVGRPRTRAVRRPEGGYLLNGRKCFISNGHLATWTVVVTCEDPENVSDTAIVLAVKAGAEGFSLGAQERKMGQKACVASELIFEDVVIPDDDVALDRRLTAGMAKPHREIAQVALDYCVAATRAGVAAFAAGVANGAYRAAYEYALDKQLPDGSRFIELQWVQTALADLAKNATIARTVYVESTFANTLGGVYSGLGSAPLLWLERLYPPKVFRAIAAKPMQSAWLNKFARDQFLGRYPAERQRLTSGLGSLAKVTASDLAVQNAHLAMDLVGADALRHDLGIEKRLRDAKLLQIYEGTNQINRVNVFKCRVREDDSVRIFVREVAA